MQLKIVSPTQSQNISVVWVEVVTLKGSMLILQGHQPTVIVIKPDSIFSWETNDGIKNTITVKSGILEVERNSVLLILE